VTGLLDALLDELAADPHALERLRGLVANDDANGPEPWIGVAAAAEHLACKRQRIYDLVHADRIPHHHDGSRLLFRRSELDAWLLDQ
jgi:excisionase family DNA binding protein